MREDTEVVSYGVKEHLQGSCLDVCNVPLVPRKCTGDLLSVVGKTDEVTHHNAAWMFLVVVFGCAVAGNDLR